jgi:hypothetical protein
LTGQSATSPAKGEARLDIPARCGQRQLKKREQNDRQPLFQAHIAASGALVVADEVGQDRGEHLPQPGQKRAFAVAAKLAEIAMGAQEGLLHGVGGICLAPESPADLHAG